MVLRNKTPDDGWVDPEETDAFAGIKNIGKKLLNFRGPQKQVGGGALNACVRVCACARVVRVVVSVCAGLNVCAPECVRV